MEAFFLFFSFFSFPFSFIFQCLLQGGYVPVHLRIDMFSPFCPVYLGYWRVHNNKMATKKGPCE